MGPAELAMLGDDRGVDAPANVELGGQPDKPRIREPNKVVENLVRDRLVERPLVAVRPDVQLERLELDAESVRHVLQVERREVGLTCLRTETRKFRYTHPNRVVAIGLRIREGL